MIPQVPATRQAERTSRAVPHLQRVRLPALGGRRPTSRSSCDRHGLRDTPYRSPAAGAGSESASLDYYVKDGEYFQFLAYKFLGDAQRWHEIADLNPQVWYPLDIAHGHLLRVPT